MVIEVDKQKTDNSKHISQNTTVFSPKEKASDKICPDVCIYNPGVLSMCNKYYMLGQTAVIYTHTHTQTHYIQNFFTQAQYSVTEQPRETQKLTQAMKARQKRPMAGPTTGWNSNQSSCIEEKQR